MSEYLQQVNGVLRVFRLQQIEHKLLSRLINDIDCVSSAAAADGAEGRISVLPATAVTGQLILANHHQLTHQQAKWDDSDTLQALIVKGVTVKRKTGRQSLRSERTQQRRNK